MWLRRCAPSLMQASVHETHPLAHLQACAELEFLCICKHALPHLASARSVQFCTPSIAHGVRTVMHPQKYTRSAHSRTPTIAHAIVLAKCALPPLASMRRSACYNGPCALQCSSICACIGAARKIHGSQVLRAQALCSQCFKKTFKELHSQLS